MSEKTVPAPGGPAAAAASFSFMPSSVQEIVLFAVIMTLLVLVARLMHYTNIRRRISSESRCAREKRQTSGGEYVVMATTASSEPMYKITYNLAAKQYLLECNCRKGDVVNSFQDIKVYDLKDNYTPERKIKKYCWCDADVATNQKAYYTGNPGLVRFMRENDTTFFTNTGK